MSFKLHRVEFRVEFRVTRRNKPKVSFKLKLVTYPNLTLWGPMTVIVLIICKSVGKFCHKNFIE